MKAQDLMIGDWLYLGETDIAVKVVAISADCDDTILVKYRCQDMDKFGRYGEMVGPEDVTPIPLTPEILEKNRFESDTNVFGYSDYELSNDFILENRGERFCLSRLINGHKSSTFFIVDIHFVHELQRALKLCWIEHDIKL